MKYPSAIIVAIIATLGNAQDGRGTDKTLAPTPAITRPGTTVDGSLPPVAVESLPPVAVESLPPITPFPTEGGGGMTPAPVSFFSRSPHVTRVSLASGTF